MGLLIGRRSRRLVIVPTLAAGCLLAGCQGSGPPTAAGGASAASAVVTVAAPPPIAVSVAPAVVAPGATRPGLPRAVVRAPAPTTAPSPPPARTTSVAPCGAYPSPKQIPLQVSPGSGTAAVSWRSDGDSTVTSYRVSAVIQRLRAGGPPARPTASVARGAGCGPLSVTVRGLGHRVSYVFWLEEARVDPGTGGLRYTLVGRAGGFVR